MTEKKSSLIIDGVEYVKKDSIKTSAPTVKGMKYCIVRTYSAGVFAGYIKERKGSEIILLNSRRLWHWKGACSLSQLAVEGTKKPTECKFAMEVPETELINAIEIIPCSAEAKENINSVPVWKI
jgi:hypothetical protein